MEGILVGRNEKTKEVSDVFRSAIGEPFKSPDKSEPPGPVVVDPEGTEGGPGGDDGSWRRKKRVNDASWKLPSRIGSRSGTRRAYPSTRVH